MSILQKIPASVRQAIYVVVTLVVSVLVVLGILDKGILENINETIGIIGGIVIALQGLLAAANVNR